MKKIIFTRKIKFRLWDTHTKTFIFFNTKKFQLDDSLNTITFQCSPVLGEKDPNGNRFSFSQFTGLLDKNGKEIFEGDIVSLKDGIGMEIRWNETELQCFINNENCMNFSGWYDEMAIIGNIYQNPELLKN